MGNSHLVILPSGLLLVRGSALNTTYFNLLSSLRYQLQFLGQDRARKVRGDNLLRPWVSTIGHEIQHRLAYVLLRYLSGHLVSKQEPLILGNRRIKKVRQASRRATLSSASLVKAICQVSIPKDIPRYPMKQIATEREGELSTPPCDFTAHRLGCDRQDHKRSRSSPRPN